MRADSILEKARMRISSPRLRRLDNALAHLPADCDAMLLGELDGYLAGLIVCPDPIEPDEWLPPVWSDDGGEVPFAEEDEARWYARLVVEHHDAVVRALNNGPGRYAPFFEVDTRHNEVLWEMWIEGFATAMTLRPESWGEIIQSGDEGAGAALTGLITLADIARDESDLEREAIDALTEDAPKLIPQWIDALHAWRSTTSPAAPASLSPLSSAKIGRNDPCPCGSGKKYKKCCGLN
ncbi:UPF0149 family protein [Sphingomonas sp. MMS24-J13]|uniref:UPF0149 family protein n=1 Tax=Sphingomonas sp. MMS24-J13 TaxID=3238686 RepID=UPI00384D8AB2